MAALLAILLALVSVFVSTRGIPRSADRNAPGLVRHRPWRMAVTGWGKAMRQRSAGREAPGTGSR